VLSFSSSSITRASQSLWFPRIHFRCSSSSLARIFFSLPCDLLLSLKRTVIVLPAPKPAKRPARLHSSTAVFGKPFSLIPGSSEVKRFPPPISQSLSFHLTDKKHFYKVRTSYGIVFKNEISSASSPQTIWTPAHKVRVRFSFLIQALSFTVTFPTKREREVEILFHHPARSTRQVFSSPLCLPEPL